MTNKTINILCVDDEPLILNALRSLFRFKYNVMTCLNANDAIAILKSHDIAVVISDQRMPNMTGAEFLEIAKEISPHTTRILLTGYSDLDAIISTVNDSEVYRFLTKPWSNEEVTQIVNEAIELSLSMKSNEEESQRKADANTAQPYPALPGTPSISNSYVILKSRFMNEYETIKDSFDQNVSLLYARNSEDVLELLATYPVKIIISNLQDSEHSIELLKYLKRELPELLSIGLVKYADHQELVTLINEAKLYRYLVMPTKPSQLIHFVNSAITMYDKFDSKPNLLKHQKVMEKAPIKPAITSIFGSIIQFFKRSKK